MSEPAAPRRRPTLEALLEKGLFAARWLMAPIYVGLVAALALLAVVFVQELVSEVPHVLGSPARAILLALSLIDLSLAANLVLLVTLSGYENFVSKIDTGGHVDRPPWMGTIDFSGMKMKLIASIVAISAIALLRGFMQLAGFSDGVGPPGAPIDEERMGWLVGLHLTFVVSGLLFAATDWLAARSGHGGGRNG